jgi:hypothetical protein
VAQPPRLHSQKLTIALRQHERLFNDIDYNQFQEIGMSNGIVDSTGKDLTPDLTVDSNSDKQLAELRELTRNLMAAVQTMQIQSSRGFELRDAINDVKAATRSMLVAPPSIAQLDGAVPGREGECGCGPCECVSHACCTFKMELASVRITQMQIEPVDAAANPFAEMELQVYPTIDGVGTICPNFFSTYSLRKPLTKPGIWYPVNVRFGTVTVCKGKPKHVIVNVAGKEVDDGGIEATAARDEYGMADVTIALDCCSAQPVTVIVEVQLDHGGLGGGTFEAMITATRECC